MTSDVNILVNILQNLILKNNKFLKLYQRLRKQYGHPQEQWKLWCKRPKTTKEKEEIIIGAILTQRTNWRNVKKALDCLKESGNLSLKNVYNLGQKKQATLAQLIKPCGFYKTKSRYLFEIAKFFKKNGGIKKIEKLSLNELRQKLLVLLGVGPETADSILLYALGKPIFVIDEYTRRLLLKKKIISTKQKISYDYLQKLFRDNLPKNYKLYQDFHALIVVDGKSSHQK